LRFSLRLSGRFTTVAVIVATSPFTIYEVSVAAHPIVSFMSFAKTDTTLQVPLFSVGFPPRVQGLAGAIRTRANTPSEFVVAVATVLCRVTIVEPSSIHAWSMPTLRRRKIPLTREVSAIHFITYTLASRQK
jgi:hypothetical protein